MGVLFKLKNLPALPVPPPDVGWKGGVEFAIYIEGELAYRFDGTVDDVGTAVPYRPIRLMTDDVTVWVEVDTYLPGTINPSTGLMYVDVVIRSAGVILFTLSNVEYDVAPSW